MASPEGKRGGAVVEGYKKFNKLTLAGSLAAAGVGVLAAPAIVAPALTLAAIDGAQIIVIDRWQKGGKNKAAMKEAKYGKHFTVKSTSNEMTVNIPNIIDLSEYREQKEKLVKAA